ncbi:MAG TPA: TldD/PmbA family protein [Candidatus Hydrothermia bacterium]|nr:TldD/PmbA family protein [Candidatus Hydrothermia bacterium]MDD5573545.1 TldD/PmbA family protein [Candidatus Hydrothermia bacterium]HOK23622.1 TldD/PmbA family protein [Candidatus Hydrothermia bacterium]HOL24328.1 TldD/PmbA family protein [Candidatus Hydrothermia bacterium]HOP31791.1 TldD/PmbA family protein [Candidatus Hydrothermia bacterium]
MKELALYFQDIARRESIEYADIRIGHYRTQFLFLQDLSPKAINDFERMGLGIRVLYDGAWGFASSTKIEKGEIERVLKKAIEIAKASSIVRGDYRVKLAQEPVHMDKYVVPIEIDPFEVPINEKINLLYGINDEMLKVKGIVKTYSYMELRRRDQTFASTEGSLIETTIFTSNAGYTAYAVGNNDTQSRSFQDYPLNKGYEHIRSLKLKENAERIANEAVMKLYAAEPDEGNMDLVLDPSNLSLTIHESVGHPTELDRVLGYEANYAGRSFATPEKLGNFKYGSSIVNFVADNTLPSGLATTGFDDEGVECQKWYIIKDGILVDYSSTREVAAILGFPRSRGSARADSFSSFPINRIPNLCLMPGDESKTPEELISDVRRGVYIEGRGSYSIDQMRLNFQFGGDLFYEIKDGKKGRMLKNVIYQSITPQFWNSLDGVTDKRFWEPRGFLTCGKGEPSQSAQMTNGAPYARFRNVKVGRGRR